MTKHLALFMFGALVLGRAAHGQFGTGATIGNSVGRKISDQINPSLRQGTRGFNTGKAKQGAAADAAPAPPPVPVNVDLALVAQGMAREALLELGKPSSKMTLFEDGHLLEVYHYRNQTIASGTVRLRDGSVSAIEARS